MISPESFQLWNVILATPNKAQETDRDPALWLTSQGNLRGSYCNQPALSGPGGSAQTLGSKSELFENCRVAYLVGMILKAIIHEAEEGGFWAEVPALPGCVTQGETREEIEANLREAVEGWLEAGETAIEIETDVILEVAV